MDFFLIRLNAASDDYLLIWEEPEVLEKEVIEIILLEVKSTAILNTIFLISTK